MERNAIQETHLQGRHGRGTISLWKDLQYNPRRAVCEDQCRWEGTDESRRTGRIACARAEVRASDPSSSWTGEDPADGFRTSNRVKHVGCSRNFPLSPQKHYDEAHRLSNGIAGTLVLVANTRDSADCWSRGSVVLTVVIGSCPLQSLSGRATLFQRNSTKGQDSMGKSSTKSLGGSFGGQNCSDNGSEEASRVAWETGEGLEPLNVSTE